VGGLLYPAHFVLRTFLPTPPCLNEVYSLCPIFLSPLSYPLSLTSQVEIEDRRR
jgi:hypothetical protein